MIPQCIVDANEVTELTTIHLLGGIWWSMNRTLVAGIRWWGRLHDCRNHILEMHVNNLNSFSTNEGRFRFSRCHSNMSHCCSLFCIVIIDSTEVWVVVAYKRCPMWVTGTRDCIMCFAWRALPQSAIQLRIFWFLLECAKDGAYLEYFVNCFTMWLIETWPKLSTIWISYEYFERVGYNWSILLIHDPMAPKRSWSCSDWFSFGGLL
jgi:hypothetical protein